jgi:hypothetical protein
VTAQDQFVVALRKAFTSLGAPDEVMTKVDEALTEVETLMKAGDTGKETDVPDEMATELKKRDDELAELRKRLTDNDALVADLKKRDEDNGKAIAEFRKRDEIATTAQRIFKAGVPLEQADELARNLHGLPEAQAKFFEAQAIAAAKQTGESELLKSFGNGRVTGTGSDGAEVEGRITKRMEKAGETREQAYAALYKGDMAFRKLVESDRTVTEERG